MSMNSTINPNDVKTALDEKFFSKYNESAGPQWASIADSDIFVQKSSDKGYEASEVQNDTGTFVKRDEMEQFDGATVKSAFLRTRKMESFAKGIDIPAEYVADEQWGTVTEMLNKMARKARLTQNKYGFQFIANGFSTSTTNEGTAIFSDSHTNINGDTIDNKSTAALAPASVNAGIVALAEQKDQSGDNVGFISQTLLVPCALFAYACEVLESELKADTANNNINAFSAKYNLTIKQHNQLGAAAGGSDTAWFLFADGHSMSRWVREAMKTNYIPPSLTKNNTGYYGAVYREEVGCITYEGLYGSDGTV